MSACDSALADGRHLCPEENDTQSDNHGDEADLVENAQTSKDGLGLCLGLLGNFVDDLVGQFGIVGLWSDLDRGLIVFCFFISLVSRQGAAVACSRLTMRWDHSSARIPSSGTSSSPLLAIVTSFAGLSPAPFSTFSM